MLLQNVFSAPRCAPCAPPISASNVTHIEAKLSYRAKKYEMNEKKHEISLKNIENASVGRIIGHLIMIKWSYKSAINRHKSAINHDE